MPHEDDMAMADEEWRGWDPRGAAPLLALGLLLTLALVVGRFAFSEDLNALLAYLVVLVLWPALLFVSTYRAVTYCYRVTNRALVVDRGFLHPPIPPLPYVEMKSIEHGGNWFASRLGIGWVAITMADNRIVKLSSVRDPGSFAELLRVRQALQPTV